MLINYIKTTLRYLWRQRLFTMLNVLGLAIGISASWVIYRIVAYEFSFDKKQPESEQIFQVVSRAQNLSLGDMHGFAGVPRGLLPYLLDEVSGLKSVVPMYYRRSESAKINSNTDQELIIQGPEKQVNTLPAYFDMIGYTWLAGDPKTALTAPDQVVLTHSRAQRYFPNALPQEVLGKTIVYNDTLSISVSGVVADLDYPNSFDAQEFFAVSAEDIANNNWGMMSSDDLLYVKLEKGGNLEPILDQLNATNTEHNKEFFEEYKYKTWYEFLPLAEKHFSTEFSAHTRVANKKVLFGLIGVAAFLLLLACINYINLSTAQMPQRAKEIGIRKTLGSTPAKLINRFLGETLMITTLSILLSILLSFLALRIFSDFIPEGMQDFVDYKAIAIFGILLIAVVTLFAGIYPA